MAPQVKLLATSREPLHLTGEHVYPVQPLQLPDPRHLPEASTLTQYESAALFIQRAQAVQPSFEVTAANTPAVVEICVRLDGLPLALELAAARIPVLSPQAMLKRLDERLKLLRSGARDLPARQQTLRNTLAWSYDLLNDDERRLFAWLGVFAGGFTLEAAEAVCDAELDTLASLVDKNVIRREGERFSMLETVREYALEQLRSSGNEETVRGRHAACFAELAEQSYIEQFERESEWSVRLEREHDNLRAALDWFVRTEGRRFLRLTGALGWFWHVHSHLAEGRARLAQALAGTSDRNEDRARALAAAGRLAAWQGDVAAARLLIEEAISIWQELGWDQEVAFALYDLGWGYIIAGDDPAARRCLEESLELQRSIGQPFLVNRAQVGFFLALVSMHEVDTVERLAPAALQLAQEVGDLRSEHYVHHYRGDCALIRGDPTWAEQHYHRALESAVELGDSLD
jgi:predicted ATPase